MGTSIHELYGEIWAKPDREFAGDIIKSLNPRNPAMLYDEFSSLGVRADAEVLDVGCGDGRHAVELARKFGCRVVGVDPIPLQIEKAERLISHIGIGDQVEVKLGCVESLPFGDASIDYVWCRDMLLHVDLTAALAECFRVLRRDGAILVYHLFATDLCEPVERARISKALSFVIESMSEEHFETALQKVGFGIVKKDKLDSEWREAEIEVGDRTLLDHLLCVARLRRADATLMKKYGGVRYEVTYAGLLLGIYQMLGKLCPMVYVLKKPS
jgi:ubiquinone/menaquinone biosynthesis C-methylase UbiE